MSNADELQKLKSLLDSGVLTQEEFNIQKKAIRVQQHYSRKSKFRGDN